MAAPTGKGVTPVRSVRIADDPWNPAKDVAALRGETLADVITRALVAYVNETDEAMCGEINPNRTDEEDFTCVRMTRHAGNKHCDGAGYVWTIKLTAIQGGKK